MDSHTLFKEFIRLVKENKKNFFRIMAILATILVGVIMLPDLLNMLNSMNDNEDSTHKNDVNPAIFEMYIEYDTGSSFTNTILLEKAMKVTEFIVSAEKETGVEISELLEKEEQVDYPKTARDRGVLGASRDEASNIWVFSAKVGSKNENLAVINYYYELFLNNEVELLQNKSRYIISEPRILSDEELLSPTTPVEQDATDQLSLKSLLLSFAIAIAGAGALSFIVLIVKSFSGNKICYAFNYSWSEEDLFVLTSKENINDFNNVLQISNKNEQIYIAQEPEKLPLLQADLIDSLSKYQGQNSIKEIVLFVQPNVTSKKWYNQQRELLKIFRVPLKIVQMND